MIDDQLNTEFDGSAPTNLAVLGNLSNNVVTPNTASQLALPSNEIGILYNNFGDFKFVHNLRTLGWYGDSLSSS